MNLAVRLYSDLAVNDKPLNIPDTWPYQVVELGDSEDLPDDGKSWQLMTKVEYDQYTNDHLETYNTWATAFYAVPLIERVKKRILSAKSFAEDLMAEYGAENVLLGRTTDQVIQISLDLVEVQPLLVSGSLYASLKKMSIFTPTALVSSATVVKYGNKIRVYVNLPVVTLQADLGNGF